ncbi:MAG: HDIG domain-containing protein [Prevotella sp.]|jgi:putative nucleotidyltransferase with HDIG domain|nr:HDIG domain-containing protein [Prevotella sp.]
MKLFKKQDEHPWRDFFEWAGFISVTAIIIVWFMPRNEGRRFNYDIGKPWMYGSFIARFDFPVYKTDEIVKKEKDSLMRKYQPYYRYHKETETANISRFYHDFKNGIPGLPKDYVNLIAGRLHQLYQSGIISTPEYNTIDKDTTSRIRVINGKVARSTQVNGIYSTITAYEQVFMDEKLNKERAVLQHCNINDYIEPNLIYDKVRSQTERAELLDGIPLASGMVLSGQKIIDRGEIIDDYDYRVLNSYEKEMKRRSATRAELTATTVGQLIFVTILLILFTSYLISYRKYYFEKTRNIMMLYSLIIIFPILTSLMIEHNVFSVYIIPFALVPIFVRSFMDSRTAFVTHATMVLICAAAVKYQYEFIIVQLTAGIVAIYSLRELSSRLQFIKTALSVTIASAIVYFAMDLLQSNHIVKADRSMYTYFFVNGVFLLLANPLMYLIEKTFGFVSDVTLVELSNTNKGVLRRLSEVAPGTFQHTITVGNLAAEIANKIGADSLLVRTGALYHDIGKMNNPVFFTENQAGVNPHNKMSCKESARIIISHVTGGIKLADQIGLPNELKAFIVTHHGRGLTKYFYVKYKNEHPDEDVNPDDFRYPGPNPSTREQAILMMTDMVEAASRSLPEHTEKSISELVNKLIDGQIAEGFFKECPITFRDIAQAKVVLTERLMSIYHTRISYPELKKRAPSHPDSDAEKSVGQKSGVDPQHLGPVKSST